MFDKALRKARVKKGFTQGQLARMVGVPQQALSYYENGGHCPVDIAIALAGFLGTELMVTYCRECPAHGIHKERVA